MKAKREILDLWEAGKAREALALAWRALEAAPDGLSEKQAVSRLLRYDPDALEGERLSDYLRLLTDPGADPAILSAAGWSYLLRDTDLLSPERDGAEMAAALENSALALALLCEDQVAQLAAEKALTRVRRFLLLEDRWRDFPKMTAALASQAALNGGAWLFDDEERARLAGAPELAVHTYLPPRPDIRDAQGYGDAVTRAVAAQYEGWPYPPWQRVLRAPGTTLAEDVRERDPQGPDTIPTPADILIAGCGTGRQTALTAVRYPQDRITSIDISQASLAYARRQCAAVGLDMIAFQLLDLHEAGKLERKFDAVLCSGVLHHLPDPEKGWEALVKVLKPGGVMRIMVYSRVARLKIEALRRTLGDLTARPVDDDLLREVRRRVMGLPPAAIPTSRDFFTLATVHDLLLHRHEDPFDIARIRRAMERFGLDLIRFEFPAAPVEAQYRQRFPHDKLQRDFDGWTRMELDHPSLFGAMYDFWCRKRQ